jgi:hypothetical protein
MITNPVAFNIAILMLLVNVWGFGILTTLVQIRDAIREKIVRDREKT